MSDNKELTVKEEGKSKKREWIKNIAIIFLSIMLLLTFFSNTIMNRTLPQVSTQYVQEGVIETQIRGTGKIEAVDPYNLVINETRTVGSVMFREGDHVNEGDVIYILEGIDSEELVKARAELDELQLSFEKGVLTNGLTRNEVAMIENGTIASISTTQAAVEGYDSKVKTLEGEIVNLNAQISALKLKLSGIQSTGTTSTYDLEKTKTDKEYNLSEKQEQLRSLTEGTEQYAALEKEINQLKADIKQIDVQIADIKNQDSVNAQNVEQQKNNIEQQISSLQSQVDTKQADIERLKNNRTEDVTAYTNLLDMAAVYKQITSKKEEVARLEEKTMGGEVKSPVAGTITSINYASGEKITPGDPAVVIQLDGKGYRTSISVTNKQAAAVNVGDEVTFENSWNLGDATANLVQITKDKENPGTNKLLVFEVNGTEITDGQSVTLCVGEKSSRYQLVVPNSAVREDNNGKFILILESKSTPFGNRYIADRVDVEVLAKDDKNTAISAGLSGYEYVITTSSKPIKGGDQIRMAE